MWIAPEKIAKIKKEFPEALACEMEGAAMAAASQFNIPFLVVRAMSDTADGEATQSFDEFIDEAGKISRNGYSFCRELSLKRKKQPSFHQ